MLEGEHEIVAEPIEPAVEAASSAADGIKTSRQFETFLRRAGFPRALAKAITAHGFDAAARGADIAPGAAAIADVLAELKAVSATFRDMSLGKPDGR